MNNTKATLINPECGKNIRTTFLNRYLIKDYPNICMSMHILAQRTVEIIRHSPPKTAAASTPARVSPPSFPSVASAASAASSPAGATIVAHTSVTPRPPL